MISKVVLVMLVVLTSLATTSCGKSEQQLAEEKRQQEVAAKIAAEKARAEEAERKAQAELKRQAEEISRLQALVRTRLKDPDSAKFGKLAVLSPEEACLPVNARNSYGGYTGEKYIALKKPQGGGDWIIHDGLSPDFADSKCRFQILLEQSKQERKQP